LAGLSVPVSKLLPRGVRCVNLDNNNITTPRGNPPSVTFRFRITVEIEKLAVNTR
jgi:hypothetical protein